jgi:minor extracellular serine protease Vpr
MIKLVLPKLVFKFFVMKLNFFTFLFVVASTYSFAQSNTTAQQAKLSPLTRLFLADRQKTNNNELPKQYVYKRDAAGNYYLSAMVRVKPTAVVADFENIGVKIGTKAGRVWTVAIPVAQLDNFIKLPSLNYIELDEPIIKNLDAVRTVTRTDSVHNGSAPLPMAYTGKNVVVGIIDAGFDYNHPTLRDTLGSKWRIKKVWEQKTMGTPPAGFAFGNEMIDSTSIKSKGTDLSQFSHATHVAGIAAGSGFGSVDNRLYRGIAFESDLVLVGITPDSTEWINTGISDIIDGMSYVYTYAASVSKPSVVNLSWGSAVGSHDGTSLFSEACDALTGKGKIFVCAAGNNGTDIIHFNKSFTATDTVVKTALTMSTGLNKTWVDVWGDSSKKFCISVTLYNGLTAGTSTGFICLDNTVHNFSLVGSDGDTCFVDVVPDSATFNNKPRMFFRFEQKSKNGILLTVKATDGNVNMWTGYVQKTIGYYGSFASGLPYALNGNSDMTASDIAATKSAIAVASFASKVNFTNLAGAGVSYTSYVALARRAPYSSKGPTADNRTKPDIAAPGLMVGSAVSSFDSSYTPTGSNYSSSVAVYHNPVDTKDYYYAMLTGTSMASPVTAGIVALMLEANPNLDPAKVMDILKTTAIHDTYTGAATPTGSNLWGYGKINAFAAVNKAITSLGITSSGGIAPIDCRLSPNPNTGICTIDFISKQNEMLQLEILDMTGKQIFVQYWKVNMGSNTTVLDISTMPKGLYFTKVSSATQGNITFKMLVQ